MKVSWKLRWYVLDSIQHKILYYDHKNDHIAKGEIDLSQVGVFSYLNLSAVMFEFDYSSNVALKEQGEQGNSLKPNQYLNLKVKRACNHSGTYFKHSSNEELNRFSRS